jgi:crossover junction endodeoxyribonuclease RuvC/BirA family biotin operon repressor/biotin-[acetyl-CoA-carboxylase] ligase
MFNQRQQFNRQSLLADRAHEMRHQPTPSEAALWSALKSNQLGVSFRRQVPIGNRYIADFLAPSVNLVVEVDGSSHAGRCVADARRDRVLQRLGYRVLRLDSQLVNTHLAAAVGQVRAAVAQRL